MTKDTPKVSSNARALDIYLCKPVKVNHQKDQEKIETFKSSNTFVASLVNVCQLGVALPPVRHRARPGAILRLRFQPGEVRLARLPSPSLSGRAAMYI